MTKGKRQIDAETLKIFWQASLKYKRMLLISLLFPLGIILLGVIGPLFIGKTLGALSSPNGQPIQFLTVFAAAAVLGLICNRIGHPTLMRHQALVMRDMQRLALSTLLRRSVGFHNDNVGGKLVSDAIDYPLAYSLLHNTMGTLVPFALILFIGSGIIYFESWLLGLVITIMSVMVIGLGIRDSLRMADMRKARLKASKAVTGQLADTVTHVQTVKTFAHEDQELKSHDKLGKTLLDNRLTSWYLMSVRGNSRMIMLAIMQIVFVAATVWLVRRDPSMLGVGIFAFTFTMMLSNRLFEVNMMLRNYEDAILQASPMTTIIMQSPEIKDHPGAMELKAKKGAIDFAGVTFRYSDGNNNETVFKDLNLKVAPGEKIGLVGPSGGGKSTLTRLLLRFEDINNGTIAIDGQNVAEVTQKSLRRAISYVPQEPLLFHRSVKENIAYGQDNASDISIKKAAKMAHADEFIAKLNDGYSTVVGERGVKLSGGQRQRIAIARAIIKDAPILVLDEATSALDSESEVLIQAALWQLMEGRTAIVIAHRLSTIQKMDRIIVLNNGQIIEQGNHKQLLKKNGLYAKLWAHQSGGFLED